MLGGIKCFLILDKYLCPMKVKLQRFFAPPLRLSTLQKDILEIVKKMSLKLSNVELAE